MENRQKGTQVKIPTVPIPKRMRALQKDRRGYPIPFIVLRDIDGKPHFTVNDSDRARRCYHERRCPICGSKLDSLLWFVGGPKSAFHPNGAFLDTAMHHECMTFALQVCPYLAAPNYTGRIDTATVDPAKLPGGNLFFDHTQIPDRPVVFVAVASKNQYASDGEIDGSKYVHPVRPYLAVEYWRNGVKLTEEEGCKYLGLTVKE